MNPSVVERNSERTDGRNKSYSYRKEVIYWFRPEPG